MQKNNINGNQNLNLIAKSSSKSFTHKLSDILKYIFYTFDVFGKMVITSHLTIA